MPSVPNASSVVYHRGIVTERNTSALVPPNQRIPFGWTGFAVPAHREAPSIVLRWKEPITPTSPIRLRVTVALDVREVKSVEARTAQTDELLGVFDIRYPSACQPFEILVAPQTVAKIGQEGIRLRQLKGELPLWLFDGGGDTPDVFAPHFLGPTSGDKWAQFEARCCSRDSLQAFGWIEGCVLDGLLQMAQLTGNATARTALTSHLRSYVTRSGDLNYEGPGSSPLHNAVYGMEGLLPFAIIAQVEPENPILKLALAAILSRLDAHNAVVDHGNTTTEGAYIAGYPLAALSRLWNRSDLAALALTQLRTRQARNVIGETIYQSVSAEGKASLPNWARGVAWYLLGFARVLNLLQPDQKENADLYTEFRRAARWAQSFQRGDGLWGNFLDDAHSRADTSGSAGIGTALALGAQRGWLPPDAGKAARRTLSGLESYLTPDGLLGGMAQFNKGGESLQRSPYRVIAPMAMGLAAQLRAQIHAKE